LNPSNGNGGKYRITIAPEKRRMEKVEEIEDKGWLHSKNGREL